MSRQPLRVSPEEARKCLAWLALEFDPLPRYDVRYFIRRLIRSSHFGHRRARRFGEDTARQPSIPIRRTIRDLSGSPYMYLPSQSIALAMTMHSKRER